MADFKIAYDKTMVNEGEYANVQGDPGGETWKGIARNFWPGWEGWELVDSWKGIEKLNLIQCRKDTILETYVQSFYKQQFWNRFLGDQIINQEVANELFDIAVNMGVSKAVTFLQSSLSIFQNALIVVIDGSFGPATFKCLDNFLLSATEHRIKAFLCDLNVQQGAWYHHLAKEHGMKKFIEGWYNRVSLR
jgi:lysozyme family protein